MKSLLKLALTLVVIGLIVWQQGDLRLVGQLLLRIEPVYIPLLLAIMTLDRALMSFKWGLLLQSRGQHLPFFDGLRIYCASMMWGMILPTTVGADVVRAFSTSHSGLDGDEVVASIVIERLVGFIIALWLGLLGLLLLFLTGILDARFGPLGWLGSLILLGAMLAFAASFSQTVFKFLDKRVLQRLATNRITRRIRQAHLAYLAYRHEKRSLSAFFGLTLVQQLISIPTFWLIARALEIEVSLLYITGAVPLAFLISRVPITISNVGVFEGVFIFVMALAGVTATESIGIALVGRILEMITWLPWWLAHVIGYGKLRPPRLVADRG